MATVFGPKGPLQATTMLAGLATDIVQYRAVKLGADADHAVKATAASIAIGIAYDNQDNINKSFPVVHTPGELVYAEIGAAVANGAKLTPDANGRLITAVATNPVIAIARETGTTLGQLLVVELVSAAVNVGP